MSLRQLSLQTEKNSHNLCLFQTGDERGLTYFHQKSYSNLFWIGKELIDDEFLVDCVLQECYLKVWAHREKIESFPHAYRFIRMNLRWQVLKQIQKPNYQIYRQSLHIDHFEKTFGELVDTQPSQDSGLEQKRIEELKKVMQYLPDKRQMIATLYFIDGMPARQIAERFKSSTLHISTEIEKSVEQLRQIVQVKKSSSPKEQQTKSDYPYSHILSQPQATVYALRQEQKMSFAGIASQLGWCQNQVQQHYIQAHQLVKNLPKQGYR